MTPAAYAVEQNSPKEGEREQLEEVSPGNEEDETLVEDEVSPDTETLPDPDVSDTEVLTQNESLPEASTLSDEEIAALSGLDSGNESSVFSLSTEDEGLITLGEIQGDKVKLFEGSNRFDTASLIAGYGWDSSHYAIIAGSNNWPDALSATSLAGALNCPILLTETYALSPETSDALKNLKVKEVIIVGSEVAVSSKVNESIKSLGISSTRLSGNDRFATQVEIFKYGRDRSLWSDKYLIVTTGNNFADALSAAPIAAKHKYPIFLTDGSGFFTNQQEDVLIDGALGSQKLFKNSLILGSSNCVSFQAEGFVRAIAKASSGNSSTSQRIAGAHRYETSSMIAQWAVTNAGFNWNNVAFATGENPNDGLGGGILQAKDNSVLLLVNDGATADATKVLPANGSISAIKIFGSTAAVSASARAAIIAHLGFIDVAYSHYSISLSRMADLEVAASVGYQGYSKTDILDSLDPSRTPMYTSGFYQFAVLSDGYSGRVSADQLNNYLSSTDLGRRGLLAGRGNAFIEAARTYNVNEVYLLSHAILESAWGTSQLASGYNYPGGKIDGIYYPAGTYYNFYGIGAVDTAALGGGRTRAIIEGWNTPEKAIIGGAKWVSNNYINPTVASAGISGPQNTLYKMKWDVRRAQSHGQVWHQYATGRTWAVGIANLMNGCYTYNRIALEKTGLRYDYPVYA